MIKNYYDEVHESESSDPESYLHKPILSHEIIQFIIQNISKKEKILELGAGGGHLSGFLINKGYNEILSGDISMVALRCASANYPSLKLICLDAQEIPIKDCSLDVVIGVEMIEHLPDVPNNLREIVRVLKTGGIYIIKTPNKWIDQFYYKFLLKKDTTKSHISLCSVSNLKELLKKNGFIPVFVKQNKLSESQIRKMSLILPHIFVLILVKCIDTLLKYLPLQFNLSLICIARKE